MNCGSCGRANRADARFCGGCGEPLAPRCPACGSESAAGARFCDACGAALVARSASASGAAEARKVVTIVFADLVGSTSLHERLDAESVRRLMDRYYRALHTAVEAHGGTVVKLLGDGVMAAFGVPRVAEDDAVRAVRAAVAIVEQVSGLRSRVSVPDTQHPTPDTRLSVRVAVNTGEVVVSGDNTDVVGDPVNVAARLQQEAHDGEVLIGESTRRLVGDVVTLARCGDLALKGRAETVAAYRVVSLERPAGAAATTFVGRDAELQRLLAVYDAAVAAPGARLAVVLGSPGLGKSRLLEEFSRRVGERATVLTAQCDAAGGGTFAPLAKAIRMRLRIDDGTGGEALRAAISAALPGEDAEQGRITGGISALLAGTPAPPEETFFVVRRLLGGFAAALPVVLAIDDLQWAEPLLLDLVEHLVQWSTGVPLLILAAARPELRDVRSSLTAAGGLVADVVTLAGLDAGAATRLAANMIGADALPAAVAGRVLATSEGNPLFLAELVRMLVNDGVLIREGDRWTSRVALADLDMPPTIHALLAARIERLRPDDRTVLEGAAVVGRQFSRAAVAHLLPSEAQDDLDARLEALQRSELIEPDAAWFLGEPALRFHHNLIRDAAYRRLLKGTRAEQHGRIADWIETRVGESVEYDEMIGWHLEQAHQHLRELGPIDERGRAFGERAARYLAAAGRRALARDDVPVAASLLGRALDRLGDADPARARLRPEASGGRAGLALDWCEALLAAGNVGQASTAVAELGRWVGDDARLRAWHTCFAGQLAVLTDPQALHTTIDAVAGAATALAAVGDAAGEAKAHSVHALVLVRLGKIGACEVALDRALAAARRGQDRRRANAVLAGAPLAALWGPSPVTRASGRCLDVVRVLRITQGAPVVEAVALRCQAVLEALRGRTAAARRMIASSRTMVEELGITQRLLEADVFAGRIELLEGDAAAAERSLRRAYDGLRAHGLGIDAAQAAALLGRALLAQQRAEEAEAVSYESEALAGDDLKAAIAWRGVRAEALARRGEHAAAVDLARAAVDIAAATDALLDHADARVALAAALRACGRSVEADSEAARAIALWEAKGASLLVERARRRGGDVAATTPTLDEHAASARGMHRRIQSNAVSASLSRFHAAVRARNLDTLSSLIADDVEVVHHPTGTSIRREEGIERFRLLFQTPDLALTTAPLATLGDSLLLARDVTSFSRLVDEQLDFGESSSSYVNLFEVDHQGRLLRVEVFAQTRLGDAIIRLYQRHAEVLAESADGARAAATARAVTTLLGPFDVERYATAIAPTVEFADHRRIGFPSGRGAEELLRSLRTLLETADAPATRVDDILALRPNGFLVCWTTTGIDRVSRGRFEYQFLRLCVFGADGLLARAEQFDVERADDALARFDELLGEDALVLSTVEGPMVEAPTARFENAATRSSDRFDSAWESRDWERVVALFPPRVCNIDRRSMMHLELTREQWLESLRPFFSWTTYRLHRETLATRGDRLALARRRFEGTDGSVGPSEFEWLEVTEAAAARGEHAFTISFDPNDLDGAYAELDERYAAGEAAPYAHVWETARRFQRAVAAREWEQAAAVLAPDLLVEDHRLLGWGTLHSRDEFLHRIRALVVVAPDATLRFDHVLGLCERGTFEVAGWRGAKRDRTFEILWASVATMGPDGRIRRLDAYDLERLAAARARFEALRNTAAGTAAIENAATRTVERGRHAWEVRDWQRFAALFAPCFRHTDRRARMHLELDRDRYLESIRPFFETASSAPTVDVLATRGNRLLMARVLVRTGPQAAADEVGPSESAFTIVVEVDDGGNHIAMVQFDPGDLDAAAGELERRYGGAAASSRRAALTRAFTQAFAARDWKALATLLAPDLVVHDHRPLGWETLHGPASYIEALRSLVDLAPDVQLRVDHLTMSASRFLYVTTWVGTHDGGAFETPSVIVCELDATDRIRRFDQYDLDQLEEARAQVEARGTLQLGEGAPNLLATPMRANAATAAADGLQAAFTARDWAAMRAGCRLDARFEDRRRHALLSGDVDWWIADAKGIAETTPDVRYERQLVRTFGNRVALERVLWTGAPTGERVEVEYLRLTAVDESGKIAAVIGFDLDNWQAAHHEAWARCCAADPRCIPPNAATRTSDRWQAAFQARDWATLEALYAPTLVLDERRRFSNTSGDRDAFAASDRWMASHGTCVARTVLATAGDRLALERRRWTAAAEAAPFEVETLHIVEVDTEGRLAANIVFDADNRRTASLEMLERYFRGAGARWTPPSQIEFMRALNAHDLKRARAALPEDFRFHDHRRTGVGHVGNADDYVASIAAAYAQSPDMITDTLYHVAVEKHGSLSVGRMFGTRIDGGEFESIFVRLNLYRDGQGVGTELFEIEDLEAARVRLAEHGLSNAGGPLHEVRVVPNAASRLRERINDAFMARDWDAMRALASGDLVFEDRRQFSLISGSVDLWLKSAEVVQSMGGVAFTDELIGAFGDRIEVRRRVVTGSGPDGGAFESGFVLLTELDADGRLAASINFDIAKRTVAFAEAQERFLSGEAAGVAGQALIVAGARTFARRDWEALREHLAHDAVIDDRRMLGMGPMGRDEWIRSLRMWADLAPELDVEQSQILSWNRHGRVAVTRVFGTVPDGGSFENVFIGVVLTSGDCIQRYEFFDLADVERALARFQALCTDVAASA